MNPIIHTKIGIFNCTEYPFIHITINDFKQEITKTDVLRFITKFRKILDGTSGHFVVYIDATNTKWVTPETRDYFGVALQNLESQFLSRHRGNYVFVKSLKIYLMAKLIAGLINPTAPLTLSFNKEKIKKRALNSLK